jgi:hypothetical protein
VTANQKAATPATLHLFLGIGLVTLSLTFFVLRYLGFQVMPHDGITRAVAYVLSGLSVVLAALALVIFKPRGVLVYARSGGQNHDGLVFPGRRRNDSGRWILPHRRAGLCDRHGRGNRRLLVVRTERLREGMKDLGR